MRTTTILVTLSLFSLLVPVAAAAPDPTAGCPAGVVPLAQCVVNEASGEAGRDVGVVVGLAGGIVGSIVTPAHDAVCTILYGSPHTCPIWDTVVRFIQQSTGGITFG